jgi:hypothetical protein
MCDAVVVPSKPEKDACTNSVLAVVSIVTKVLPVPGEVGPLNAALYEIGAAAAVHPKQRAMTRAGKERFMVPPNWPLIIHPFKT